MITNISFLPTVDATTESIAAMMTRLIVKLASFGLFGPRLRAFDRLAATQHNDRQAQYSTYSVVSDCR